jgi:putative MATE family efflux protein
LTLVVIVTSAGLLTIRPLFRVLGADDATLILVSKYIHIWYLGTMFVVVPMVGNAAIRGTGDTKTPAWIMTSAAVGNIILDPLLIFGLGPFPRMELQGAALATVIARATTMVTALYILIVRDKLVLFALPKPKELWSHWKKILVVGGPAALTSVLGPLSFGILTRLVSQYGAGPVAAFGAGIRVDMFAMMLPFAVGSGVMIFVGQNWGAGRRDRVSSAIGMTQRSLFFSGIGIWALIFLLAHPIALLFSGEEAVLVPMRFFLRVVEIGLAGDALFVITVQTYNALRRPSRVVATYVIRLFLLFVPFAIIGSKLWGVDGMFIGMGTARLLNGLVAYVFVRPVKQDNGASSS